MKLESKNILFSKADLAALERVCEATGSTMSDVIRWALRYYVAAGPWTSKSPTRRAAVRLIGNPMVGPVVINPGVRNGETA